MKTAIKNCLLPALFLWLAFAWGGSANAASADLSLNAGYYFPGPSLLGQGKTMLLTVSNAGPATATGVVISNQLPPYVNITSISAGQTTIYPDGRVTIGLGTLPAGESVTFDLVVLPRTGFIGTGGTVNPIDILSAQLTNRFVVSANEPDPNPANNSATTSFEVDYSFPGTPSSPYDLGILHLSTSNRVIVDFFPNSKDEPTLYAGSSLYQFPGPNADGSYNYAHLYFNEAYPGDVVILAGTNTGPGANIALTNWLAVIRFFNPADPNGVSLPATEKQAYFPATAIDPYGFTNFTLLPNAIYVTGSATGSNGFVTASAVYGAEASGFFGKPYYYYVPVTASHRPSGLRLSGISTPEPVVVGNNLVYSLAISNSLPRTATGVIISNALPANVRFLSATGGIAVTNNGILLINVAPLAVGATNLVQVVMQPNAVENLTNRFRIFCDQPDPDPNNGFATIVSTVNDVSTPFSADLSVTSTNFAWITVGNLVEGGDVAVGGFVTNWITVSNAGPATATGVVISNPLPATVNFISAAGGTAATNNGAVVVSLGSLPAGANRLVPVIVQPTINFVNAYIGAGAFLTNVFTVFADEPDPVAGNNAASGYMVVGALIPGIQLGPGVAGSVTVNTIGAINDPSDYFTGTTVLYTNGVPGDLVFLADPNGAVTNIANWVAVMRFFNPADPDGTLGLPATTTQAFFPASVTGGTGFTNFSLLPYRLNFVANSGFTPGTILTTLNIFGPAGAILSGQLDILLYLAVFVPIAGLSLDATVQPSPVTVGSNLVYSLTVSNAGPQPATGVILSNQLPANATFISATGGATPTNGVLLVNLGTIPVGGTASAQITLQATATGTLTNQIVALANEREPAAQSNYSAIVVTSVTAASTAAELSLRAAGSPAPVPVGGDLVFSLTISNAGPATATGAMIASQLPAGIGFDFATGVTGVTSTNGVLLLNLAPLAAGAANQIQISARTTLVGGFTNVFQVSAPEADPNLINNSATVVSTVTNAPAVLGTGLNIVRSGPNVILTWSAGAVGYTLQSTTNLVSPTTWSAVFPLPVIVSGLNTVTNPIAGIQLFYRLSQ